MNKLELAQCIESGVGSKKGVAGCLQILRPNLNAPLSSTNMPVVQNFNMDSANTGIAKCRFLAIGLIENGCALREIDNGIEFYYTYPDENTCQLSFAGYTALKNYMAQSVGRQSDPNTAAIDRICA